MVEPSRAPATCRSGGARGTREEPPPSVVGALCGPDARRRLSALWEGR